MTHVQTVMLSAFCVSLSMSLPASVEGFGSQQLTPQAAKQYASDSEKASRGDADAAYRMGEALESGRLGIKDPRKALTYYRQAAQGGREDAAARVAQIESELGQIQKKQASAPASRGH